MKAIKNLRYILGGVCALMITASCNKLNEKPYSSIFTESFYKTASDAEAALTAAYGPMTGYILQQQPAYLILVLTRSIQDP